MRYLDEMKLARVIDACGGIDGRVKMQKIVYLLKSMGYDLPFDDFVIRQQGPFSRAVACSADVLTGGGFVEETSIMLGTDTCGEPIKQYDYRVREGIVALTREHFDVAAPPSGPPLNEIAAELRGKDRKVLEVAATRLYLEREDGLTGEALETELRRLKGHLIEAFDPAEELLADLRDRGLL